MSLTLHFHPLSSFCWKALIALYENDTPFTPNLVNLGNEAERAALLKLWPIGKFPVLRDDTRGQHRPGIEHHHRISRSAIIPAGHGSFPMTPTLRCRPGLRDRFYDLLCPPAGAEHRRRPAAPGRHRRIRTAPRRRGRD